MNIIIDDDPPIDIEIALEEIGITSTAPIPISLFSTQIEGDATSFPSPVTVQLQNPLTDFIEVNEIFVTEVSAIWPDPLLFNITNYLSTSLPITDVNFTEITASNVPVTIPISFQSTVLVEDQTFTEITATPTSFPTTITVQLADPAKDEIPVALAAGSTFLHATNEPDPWLVTLGTTIQAGEPVKNKMTVNFDPDPVSVDNPPELLTVTNNVTEPIPVTLNIGIPQLLGFPVEFDVSQTETITGTINPFNTSLAAWPALVNINIANQTPALDVENTLNEKLIVKADVETATKTVNTLKYPPPILRGLLSKYYPMYKSRYINESLIPENKQLAATIGNGVIRFPLTTNGAAFTHFYTYEGGKTLFTWSWSLNKGINYTTAQQLQCILDSSVGSNILFEWSDDADADTFSIELQVKTKRLIVSNVTIETIPQNSFNIDTLDGTGPSGVDFATERYNSPIINYWIFQTHTSYICGFVINSVYVPFHAVNYLSTPVLYGKTGKNRCTFSRVTTTSFSETVGLDFHGFGISKSILPKSVMQPIASLVLNIGPYTTTGDWNGPYPVAKIYTTDILSVPNIHKIQYTSTTDVRIRLHVADINEFVLSGTSASPFATITAEEGIPSGSIISSNFLYTFFSGIVQANQTIVIDFREIFHWSLFTPDIEIVLSLQELGGSTISTVAGSLIFSISTL